jgi:hypothetical protein
VDRFLEGYGWEGRHHRPAMDVVSLYVEQVGDNDLSRERARRHPQMKIYPTIAEALTQGGNNLAVDGVLLIGEHGKYPKNEKGQTLYPRYEWFKECVKVFETSGRAVPVFNDKHLSTTWQRCAEMVSDAKRLGIAFLAGSSLPVTRRMPAIDMPHDAALSESVCVAYGGVDSYDFHALETAQCMSERRKGGEVGIRSVHALQGEAMWDMLASQDREPTRQLMVSALTRSHNLPVDTGYYTDRITFDWAKKSFPDGLAYFIEHRDGFRTTIFLLGIQDFNYAGLRSDNGEIVSCQMYLPMPGHGSTTADFFHPLTHHIEDTILTGKTPYPIERTLLTSGMTLAAVDSLYRKALVETPEMEVRYSVGPESTFWQD